VTHADALSAKVESAWSVHRSSFRHEKVNLEAVLEMLDEAKPDRQGSNAAASNAPSAPQLEMMASGIDQAPSLTLQEALQMTAAFVDNSGTTTKRQTLDMSKLAKQFDPIVV